jgi:phenylpropionate dioxygenase-like ring-hydroxylating dioxygenase large terminal subunit
MIPVSLSGGVEPGARTGTSVNGHPVVVWRGQDGVARAWADRCPHRGMRLSFGFVRGNSLTCIYHGWSFGDQDGQPRGGQCLAVPAHPGMSPPVKAAVPAFPAAEVLGMIWVGEGPGDTQPPHGAMLDSRDVHPVRSVTVRAPAHALRTALEAALPPGAETAETPQAAETWSAGGGIITFKGSAALVIAAIQDRGDGTSAAHVVTTDPDRAARKALCEWAALVRDHLAAVVLP